MLDIIPEINDYKGFIKQAYKRAKSRLGGQMTKKDFAETEPKDEYDTTLKDEFKLEVAFILKELANKVEANTLDKIKAERQARKALNKPL